MHVPETNLSAFQKSSINLNKNSECYLIISNYTAYYDLIADQSRQAASGLSAEAFQAVVLYEAYKLDIECLASNLDGGEIIVLTITDEEKIHELINRIGPRFQHCVTDENGLILMYEHYEFFDPSDVASDRPKVVTEALHLDA